MAHRTELTRGAGVLLPVSSLPSRYGIGTLGKAAFDCLSFLSEAGQKYWQVLPLGPTSYGDSPYQSFSAFAGNPYYIDLELLAEQGLLTRQELDDLPPCPPDQVDYTYLFESRIQLLKTAYSRWDKSDAGFASFCQEQEGWLSDYALFMALKEHFHYQDWLNWDEEIRMYDPQAVKEYTEKLQEDIGFWKFCQYQFARQWEAVKARAHELGIQIIGDMPLYVAMDSADVWANRHLFQLDELGHPTAVAGVPPDAFSNTGQLWGNPLYDWKAMEKEQFAFWENRVRHLASWYDIIRIDHFIGIARYYAIPAGSRTAAGGEWQPGPGRQLTDVIDRAAASVGNGAKIVAEDLGVQHPSVARLLEQTGYPTMKVLQFAFDGGPDNPHLPHHYHQNMVVYGGTHDNDTLVGFYRSSSKQQKRFMKEYLGLKRARQIPDALMRAAYASVASIAVFQMQDWLKMGSGARMNTPATVGDNWQWRLKPEQLTPKLARQMRQMAQMYSR